MLTALPTPLGALLLALSFFGLCAWNRAALRLNRFIAPYAAVSEIIVILMLSGMLHALPWGFYLLFFGGFAGLIDAYAVRRAKPDWALIGAFCLFAGYLAWRLLPEHLAEWDDLSHWGLVARYLLEKDAFPDASATAVTFQSYPLGAAAFIYYVGKALGNTEGVYLFAQNLLYGPLFLPVLAHVKGNRKLLTGALAFAFCLLFRFNRDLTNLFVDWLLAFFGIGAAASVLYYRDDLRKALLSGLPGIAAVVYLKNSGLFFALATALLLGWAAGRQKKSRKAAAGCCLLCLGAGILAYLLWTLHVKLDFVAGLSSKHAISLASYASHASSKSLFTVLRIVKRMLMALIRPYFFQVFTVLCAIAGFLLVRFAGRSQPKWEQKRAFAARALWACVICYAVWHFMIFLMYIFSMSTSEALRLASYWRYSSTGMVFCLGMELVILADYFSEARLTARWIPAACAGTAAACLATAPFLVQKPASYYPQFVVRDGSYNDLRAGVIRAREDYGLQEDGHYLTFSGGDVIGAAVNAYYRAVKYDLNSLNIDSIARIVKNDGETTDEYTLSATDETVPSPIPFLERHLEEYDAFLILFQDDAFESLMDEFMKSYDGDTPVIFIYR